ncbi:uncharacterized protein AKAW2_30030S [Aspergillus luchuensis]|uniref:Uncharacterized protein n=1 Tax=Aspergillus kawachii TaxID=1069201 RepID=A0A7R7ZX23_ASPKA|nr:uncharacterized protein AKAW2_30030S [Aspergillus luchuensis]BCR96711.1 hypothetical protein AKAW2_30030S [Aspergillus luchuensis]
MLSDLSSAPDPPSDSTSYLRSIIPLFIPGDLPPHASSKLLVNDVFCLASDYVRVVVTDHYLVLRAIFITCSNIL